MEQSIISYNSNQQHPIDDSLNNNDMFLINQVKFQQFIKNGHCCDDCKKIFIISNDELVKISTNCSDTGERLVLMGMFGVNSSIHF